MCVCAHVCADAVGRELPRVQERMPEWLKFKERLHERIGPQTDMTLLEFLYAECRKKEELNEGDASMQANLNLHHST